MEADSNFITTPSDSPRRDPYSLLKSTSLAVCAIVSAGIVILVCLAVYGWIVRAQLFCDGCDSFTYMAMAEDMRQARTTGHQANFFLPDDHTRFLIETMKHSSYPTRVWSEMVAPHGFHYFPGTDQVAPMYPPGTPWELSLFPKWDANRVLKITSLAFIALAALALIAWCWWRRLAWSCASVPVVVWAYAGGFLNFDAYSIDSTLVPMILAVAAGWIALEGRNRLVSIVVALLSGIFLGQVVQDRIGSVLLAPLMAMIFLPRRWGLLACYMAGVLVNGILPLLLHAKTITGSYFFPTYNRGDTAQSLDSIRPNLAFYGQHLGDSGIAFFGELVLILAALSLIIRASGPANIGWRAWMWDYAGGLCAPVAVILVTIAFFLVHRAHQPYYPVPGVLLGCTVMICVCVSVESHWQKAGAGGARRAMATSLAAVLVLAGAVGAKSKLGLRASEGVASLRHPESWTAANLELPTELQAGDAWIWADRLSGSIRYYDQRPAFKIFFGPPEPRQLIYDAVRAKGDPQYMIEDSEMMNKKITEAKSWGWRFTLVGSVQGEPCYRMEK